MQPDLDVVGFQQQGPEEPESARPFCSRHEALKFLWVLGFRVLGFRV